MAFTKSDKDWLGETINNSLLNFHRQVNEPALNGIVDDIRDLKKDVSNLKKEIGGIKKDMDNMELRLSRRLDDIAEVVTDVKTNHEKRIRRLEKETGVDSSSSILL